MASANEGEVTEPFRSEFGWHILEVKGRRDKDFSGDIQRNQVANYIESKNIRKSLTPGYVKSEKRLLSTSSN